MRCEEALTRIWEYLDQELAPEEARTVWAHFDGCPSCYPAYCCNRAFLKLVARQRSRCTAPDELVLYLGRLASS